MEPMVNLSTSSIEKVWFELRKVHMQMKLISVLFQFVAITNLFRGA